MDPNEKLTGITQMAPPSMMAGGMGGGQPPMPPMPPMPPRGGGQPPMPEPGVGEMAMQGQEPPMEEPAMSVEQDSAALAQAVVGRTQGDIGAAVAVLDNAKALLIASTEQQEPQMMMHGGEVHYKKMGGPLYREGGGALKPVPEDNKGLSKLPQEVRNNMGFMNMGGPLYRKGGGGMSDSDVLRQMIMENLQKPAVQEQAMAKAMNQMSQPQQVSKADAMSDLMNYRMS